jgi:hypothetical protein
LLCLAPWTNENNETQIKTNKDKWWLWIIQKNCSTPKENKLGICLTH